MKFNHEKFTEKVLDSGMADEFESPLFKKEQVEIMKRIDELTEKIVKTLTSEQRAIFDELAEAEIENENVTVKQAFYKGYMLAHSLFKD